ncbi:hypothetical protein ACA910_014229 [Epithemia clementina (nom. ined.)]
MRYCRKVLSFAAAGYVKLPCVASFHIKQPCIIRSFPNGNINLSFSETTERSMSSFDREETNHQASQDQSQNDFNSAAADEPKNDSIEPKPVRKTHTMTVCMVPPPSYVQVWQSVSSMRELLRDPGLFRWPPHVNLLYPFVDLEAMTEQDEEDGKQDKTSSRLEETVGRLRAATQEISPFSVSLNAFGTFGGRNRGVLWLYPDSGTIRAKEGGSGDSTLLPLMELHAKLEVQFPMCQDLSHKGGGGKFSPHMTLSHFENLTDALAAQAMLEENFVLDELSFLMDRIYLLQRKGDGGQFHRVAEIYLGSNNYANKQGFEIHQTPLPFPEMPTTEVDWVYQERMALKKRRNWSGNNRGSRKNRRGRRRDDGPRVPDTPEEIERKRSERRLKRERLAQEQSDKDKDSIHS